MVRPHDLFPGVYWIETDAGERLATVNLVPGVSVYGEPLIKEGDIEYRLWDPYRSKIGAAIRNGLRELAIKPSSFVLYLGAASGTTVSHVSDIVGSGGVVFAVELSGRVARELVERVASHRSNVLPIIEDARRPDLYFSIYTLVDVTYVDVAQPDETEIALRNAARYLKPNGQLMVALKARSIDVTKEPRDVFAQEVAKMEAEFTVKQVLRLEPYDRDHALVVLQHKPGAA